MIFYISLVGAAIILYITVLQSLFKILIMKIKYGKNALISFYPFYGEFFLLNKSLEKYRDSVTMYQKRFTANPHIKFIISNIMHKVIVFIYDPEYYKQVLLNHEQYTKVEIFYHPKLSSNSILFGEPQKVKQQRNLLGESFTFEKLKQRTPIINQVLLNKLEQYDYKKQDMLNFLTKTSSDIIIKTFFCKELQEIIIQGNDITTEMIEIITEIGRLQIFDVYVGAKLALLGRKSFKILLSQKEKILNQRIDRLVDDTLMPIVKQKIASFKKTTQHDFLDIYVEAFLNQKPNEPKITELELCQLFVSIVSAGTDTSSHQTALTLYYLGIHKEAQSEIREELEKVVGQDKEITPDHLKKLVLLNAFINESFRVKNTVIQPLTRIAKETHYIKDLKIEKGMFVSAFTSAPSWNEKFYNDPLKFDYKRWLTDTPIKQDNGYVFVPFSAGGRNCIGQHMAMMTMKIMIGQILRTHEIVVDPSVQASFPLVVFIQYHPKDLVQIVKLKK